MPRAYIEITLSSKPGSRRAYFSTSRGSKRPARSRGTSRSSAPSSVSTRLRLCPLRRFSASRSDSRCASISASSARSATAFFRSSIRLPSRNASAGSWPASNSSSNASLILPPSRVSLAMLGPPSWTHAMARDTENLTVSSARSSATCTACRHRNSVALRRFSHSSRPVALRRGFHLPANLRAGRSARASAHISGNSGPTTLPAGPSGRRKPTEPARRHRHRASLRTVAP